MARTVKLELEHLDGRLLVGQNPVTLGLVGLHIVHKTDSEPQWIWSTFEHVNNVPAAADPAGAHYNFYRAGCATSAMSTPAPMPTPTR